MLVLNLEQDVFVSTYAVLPEESFGVKRDMLGVVLVDPADENLLLLGFKKCGLLVEWNLRDAKAGHRYQGPPCLEAAAFKRDGKMLMAGYQDGSVAIFTRDPPKVFKSYFSSAGHRAVKWIDWSERAGSNIILIAGSAPAEGVALLSGTPLSKATSIAAARPVTAFFLDPSPHLSETEPAAFVIVTETKVCVGHDVFAFLSRVVRFSRSIAQPWNRFLCLLFLGPNFQLLTQ